MEQLPPDLSVTQLLESAHAGDTTALERLIALLYTELHRIAASHLQRERSDHTLQPTALVHEAFLRLTGSGIPAFTGREHFLNASAQAMRRVLIDHARAHRAAKRAGNLKVTLPEGLHAASSEVDLLVLGEALERLAAAEPRWAQVVELRYFVGLELTEVAATLGISLATVKRDWQFARAWLLRQLDGAA